MSGPGLVHFNLFLSQDSGVSYCDVRYVVKGSHRCGFKFVNPALQTSHVAELMPGPLVGTAGSKHNLGTLRYGTYLPK
jgi:hypothetical protein